MEAKKETQIMISNAFQDPLIELLLKKSNLTKIQFETLMIDLIIDVTYDEKIPFNEKTLFRARKVSRGSFSRTLSQARNHIISSIFTIVLLSYMGVYDSKFLEDYQNLAEKLREYRNSAKSSSVNPSSALYKRIEEELIIGIESLSRPRKLKIL
jgi:hypothetical protein